jgi:hypothetical protein
MGGRLVAVSHQINGLVDFQSKYFKGDVYLDPTKTFYRALGNNNAKVADIALPEVRAAGKAAYKRLKHLDPSYELSQEGEGLLLGGTFVFAPRSGAVLFMHREMFFGDVAEPAALLEAANQGHARL